MLPGRRVGALRNAGAGCATADLLAFVDADHELDPNWMAAAIAGMKNDRVAAVGADCLPPPRPTWVQSTYDGFRRHDAGRREVEWLGSGNMVVRRDPFLQIGGFDERLETCEDVDLCRRLRALGYLLLADEALRNIHYGDPGTLKQVFAGERWRGRDNVRVSLRPPFEWRTVASALIPLVTLGGLGAVAIGLAVADSPVIVSMGTIAMLGPVGLRTARTRGAFGSLRQFLQAGAVAAAYEGGRALALASRAGHATRRSAS
jgi:hypothetical protein